MVAAIAFAALTLAASGVTAHHHGYGNHGGFGDHAHNNGSVSPNNTGSNSPSTSTTTDVPQPTSTGRTMRVRSSRASAPSSFKKTNSFLKSSNQNVSLNIHLKKSNRDGLEQRLLAASDPSSSSYGQYLSKSEVEDYVRPTQDTTTAVTAWLAEYNITATSASSAGDVLSITIPVATANTLLSASYSLYEHDSGGTALRTLSYSLPVDMDEHVNVVAPTTDFVVNPEVVDPGKFTSGTAANLTAWIESYVATGNQDKMRAKSKRMDDFCDSWMTPQCSSELYGYPLTGSLDSAASMTVTGFIKEYANSYDLQQFLNQLRPDMANTTTFQTKLIYGGDDPQAGSDAGVEANLDIQYSVGVAGHIVPITFLSVGDTGSNSNGFIDVVSWLVDQVDLPHVLATSYGIVESQIGQDLAQTMCDQYMQLGARGVSVIYSSGDSGVGDSCSTFAPTFPSGCPYVTSVGATDGYGPEKGASFSGGGFSNYFARPSWQSSDYVDNLGSKYSGLYNSSGRGYPDVSAQGTNFPIVVNSAWNPEGGTSASTPLFASIIALLNAELVQAGKSPLGFLNQWLYSNQDAFTDITSGNNPGCNVDGFDATSGWDPITGLGTPLYDKMRSAAGL